MCGVIGFISKNKAPVNDLFEKNYPTILDRGIFFDSVITDEQALGYVRLPTDAIACKEINHIQQIQGNYFLFNGLITNVGDLCKLFSLPREAKISDTICLENGYVKYGGTFLEKCRGMFAFAYVTQTEIILVRDTIGIKPLYYVNSQTVFGFCSEMKGLKGLGEIHEVLPGEIIIYNKHKQKISKKKFMYKSYKKYTKKDLYSCLVESIVYPTRRYLNQSKNKKIAFLLSGGIDSALMLYILALSLSKQLKKRIVAFTVGIEGSADMYYAGSLAKALRIKLVAVLPYSEEESLHKSSEIVYTVESSLTRVVKVALLQDAVAQKIQNLGIQVVISGEGSDELFYGYERFIEGLTRVQIKKLFKYFFKNVFYYTLLQRFERVFARRQIEGRVPLLDQELIEVAKKFLVKEKIGVLEGVSLSKIPLRKLAKELGMSKEFYLRHKEKMTVGATKQKNEEGEDGYLEGFVSKKLGISYRSLLSRSYIEHFLPQKETSSPLQVLGSEEEAMQIAQKFITQNRMKGVLI